jgi:hypothetical protein
MVRVRVRVRVALIVVIPFSVWTQFTVPTSKRSKHPRGMALVTLMAALQASKGVNPNSTWELQNSAQTTAPCVTRWLQENSFFFSLCGNGTAAAPDASHGWLEFLPRCDARVHG